MPGELSRDITQLVLRYQRDELTSGILYAKIGRAQKDEKNREILLDLSEVEKRHAEIWKSYTGRNLAPNRLKIFWYMLLYRVLGFTFAVKLMEKNQAFDIEEYESIIKEIPEARHIMEDEIAHEGALLNLLDEERLKYVGAMVLGLNDALVELTATLAGLTFALANTSMVALAGIITGISATLSMAASNYLAERANNNPNAIKLSLYTGIAYLFTIILMEFPYFVLPPSMYMTAFVVMLAVVLLIIVFFNYYIAVARSVSFKKRFGEMALVSLSVAFIAFLIGMLAKHLLGLDV